MLDEGCETCLDTTDGNASVLVKCHQVHPAIVGEGRKDLLIRMLVEYDLV